MQKFNKSTKWHPALALACMLVLSPSIAIAAPGAITFYGKVVQDTCRVTERKGQINVAAACYYTDKDKNKPGNLKLNNGARVRTPKAIMEVKKVKDVKPLGYEVLVQYD